MGAKKELRRAQTMQILKELEMEQVGKKEIREANERLEEFRRAVEKARMRKEFADTRDQFARDVEELKTRQAEAKKQRLEKQLERQEYAEQLRDRRAAGEKIGLKELLIRSFK